MLRRVPPVLQSCPVLIATLLGGCTGGSPGDLSSASGTDSATGQTTSGITSATALGTDAADATGGSSATDGTSQSGESLGTGASDTTASRDTDDTATQTSEDSTSTGDESGSSSGGEGGVNPLEWDCQLAPRLINGDSRIAVGDDTIAVVGRNGGGWPAPLSLSRMDMTGIDAGPQTVIHEPGAAFYGYRPTLVWQGEGWGVLYRRESFTGGGGSSIYFAFVDANGDMTTEPTSVGLSFPVGRPSMLWKDSEFVSAVFDDVSSRVSITRIGTDGSILDTVDTALPDSNLDPVGVSSEPVTLHDVGNELLATWRSSSGPTFQRYALTGAANTGPVALVDSPSYADVTDFLRAVRVDDGISMVQATHSSEGYSRYLRTSLSGVVTVPEAPLTDAFSTAIGAGYSLASQGEELGVAYVLAESGNPDISQVFFQRVAFDGSLIGDPVRVTDYPSAGNSARTVQLIWSGIGYLLLSTGNGDMQGTWLQSVCFDE